MSGAVVKALPLEGRILTIRGHREMLDEDLAEICGVPARRHDGTITALVSAIRQLMETPGRKKRKIGFGGSE